MTSATTQSVVLVMVEKWFVSQRHLRNSKLCSMTHPFTLVKQLDKLQRLLSAQRCRTGCNSLHIFTPPFDVKALTGIVKTCKYLEASSNRSATACKSSRFMQRPICPDKCIHMQIHSRVFHRIQNKFLIDFLKKLQLSSVTDERGVAGGWHSGQIEYSRTTSRLKVRQLLDRWNLSPPSDAKILSPSPNTAARVQT